MRIAHLTLSTTTEITGGLEYHIAYLTAALQERGHETIVVRMGAGPTPGECAAWSRVVAAPPSALHHRLDALWETLVMFGRRLLNAREMLRVAEHVDGLKPDLVHQHAYIGGIGASLLLARKYPLVFTNHTGAYLHLDRMPFIRYAQRRLMKRFAGVIGPSRELVPATDNGCYVPNGVDTSRFFPVSDDEREVLKAKHGCAGKRVFICPRRWAPTKGVVYLAGALRHLSPGTRDRSVFLFAGNETPGYARYQQNVRETLAGALDCEVRVLGNLGHVALAELMSISDACVIPSLMEATSLACLEAMASGTPVLGTATGGLVELIQPGQNGWLVPLRDERALADRIEAIGRMPREALEEMRHCALETVRERYTWQAAAEATERVYLRAVEKWQRENAGGAVETRVT